MCLLLGIGYVFVVCVIWLIVFVCVDDGRFSMYLLVCSRLWVVCELVVMLIMLC